MKQTFVIVTLLFLTSNLFSQNNYEAGYFINNDGQRTNGLIKNIDWKNNPVEFNYKSTQNDSPKTMSIENIKEFGVIGKAKFIRETLKIDRSTSNVGELTESRMPTFKEETLFLKTLIEGDANLYYYEDRNLRRFFFSQEDSEIEQLVFKNFRKDQGVIGENNHYKQQLLNTLKCSPKFENDIRAAKYTKEYLIKIFEKHNTCSNSEEVNYTKKEKKDIFNLSLKLGITSSSLKINSDNSPERNVSFDSELGFRIGAEAEFILPFNNDKWTFILNPNIQNYTSSKVITNEDTIGVLNSFNAEINYNRIEIPAGVRHYFFLNDTCGAYEIGIGYNHNNKLSAELNYGLTRDVLNNFNTYTSDYNVISLIFGYTIL